MYYAAYSIVMGSSWTCGADCVIHWDLGRANTQDHHHSEATPKTLTIQPASRLHAPASQSPRSSHRLPPFAPACMLSRDL